MMTIKELEEATTDAEAGGTSAWLDIKEVDRLKWEASYGEVGGGVKLLTVAGAILIGAARIARAILAVGRTIQTVGDQIALEIRSRPK